MLSPEYPWSAYWTGGVVVLMGVISVLIVFFRERSKIRKENKKGRKKMDILKRILYERYGGWFPPRIGIPNNKVGRNEVSKKKGNKSINRALEKGRTKKMKKYRKKG